MLKKMVYYCEGPDCDTHQATTTACLPPGWILVQEIAERELVSFAFCGWNCVLTFSSRIDPPTFIER